MKKHIRPEDVIDASDCQPLPDDGINMNPWGDEEEGDDLDTDPAHGLRMYSLILETVANGGVVRLDGHVTTISKSKWVDDPENEVLLFGWREDGQDYCEQITEEDLNNSTIDDGNIVIPDVDSHQFMTLTLYRKYEVK